MPAMGDEVFFNDPFPIENVKPMATLDRPNLVDSNKYLFRLPAPENPLLTRVLLIRRSHLTRGRGDDF